MQAIIVFCCALLAISVNSVKADDSPYGKCIYSLFDAANQDFNQALNISTGINWTKGIQLNDIVTKIINSKGIDGLNNACNARQAFSKQLAITYPFCLDRYYLLTLSDTDLNNAIYYVHLFKHLEFICSAAYEVYIYENSCIAGGETLPGYKQCRNNFATALKNDAQSLCSSVATLMSCNQNFFLSLNSCSSAAAWVECEKERVGFAYDCPNLKCEALPKSS